MHKIVPIHIDTKMPRNKQTKKLIDFKYGAELAKTIKNQIIKRLFHIAF